ncbi:hypothetical protein ACFV19_28215, partial [Streptomyces griseoluteus]
MSAGRLGVTEEGAEVVEAASPGSGNKEDAAALGGYQQELKWTLGSFQVFAISFAFISVAVGTFSTYDDVLQNAGPVGIWLWGVATVGQVLVALVVAQLAGRIALSGSSAQPRPAEQLERRPPGCRGAR